MLIPVKFGGRFSGIQRLILALNSPKEYDSLTSL